MKPYLSCLLASVLVLVTLSVPGNSSPRFDQDSAGSAGGRGPRQMFFLSVGVLDAPAIDGERGSFAKDTVAQKNDAQTTPVEKVKSKIARLGAGEKAKATVILKDGTKKKGYIAQAGDEEFVLRDRKTDAPATIRYTDVAKVESNRGHSTARNIAIGVGIGVGALLLALAVAISSLD